MASRLHSKKEKKQEKTKRVSHLRDVEDMFFGLTMWDCFFLLRGKLKVKHLSLFIMGGRVGKKDWRGGSHGFQGNRGEKQSLLTRHKGGGGYRTLPANGGDHKNTTKLWRGGTRLISGWYNKNPPIPPLDNIYSDWSQTWQSLHGWQYTRTHNK